MHKFIVYTLYSMTISYLDFINIMNKGMHVILLFRSFNNNSLSSIYPTKLILNIIRQSTKSYQSVLQKLLSAHNHLKRVVICNLFIICNLFVICMYNMQPIYYSRRKNNCLKMSPAHSQITKRVFVSRGSCFCEKYSCSLFIICNLSIL